MGRPILVTGGTGTLGREVVRCLLDEGREVRVMSRRPRPASASGPGSRPGTQWAAADLLSGDGVADAVTGVDAIVHCATTLGQRDVRATHQLVRAARAAGSPHLVYISIVGIDRVPLRYYRAKLASEQVVSESGLPWTILRTTQFHDLVARLTDVQRLLPVAFTLGGGLRLQPVEVSEVAARLTALSLAKPTGRAADMGGPQVRSLAELTKLTLGARGRRRPVVSLRLPGPSFRAARAGGLLAEDHAVGRSTYEHYLRQPES